MYIKIPLDADFWEEFNIGLESVKEGCVVYNKEYMEKGVK